MKLLSGETKEVFHAKIAKIAKEEGVEEELRSTVRENLSLADESI